MKDTRNSFLAPAAFLIFGFCIFLIYSNTFNSPFTFDDEINITYNHAIKYGKISIQGLYEIFELSPNKWRWLPNISFALNYYLDGFNVFGFHLVNTIIHLLNAYVFFLLARLILNLPSFKSRICHTGEIALAAALLWAVHPLQTNAVTYIVQRMTSMAALFFLLALFFYIKGQLQDSSSKKTFFFLLTALFGIMALFSKENSSMLPIMVLGLEFFFLQKGDMSPVKRTRKIVAAAGVILLFISLVWYFLGSTPFTNILSSYTYRDFSLGQRLLTQPRVIIHYLSLLALPLPSRLTLAYDFPLSTGLINPMQTLPALVSIVVMAGLIFLLRKRAPLAAFGIFWLLGNLLVESSFIGLEMVFEHRMYLPSMFLLLAAVSWSYKLFAEKIAFPRAVILAGVLILALFTWQRNMAWKDEITLWTDIVNKAPNLARGYTNLGKAYDANEQFREAERHLLKAIDLDPRIGETYIILGKTYERLNQLPDAIAILNRGLGLRSNSPAMLHNILAVVYIRMGDYHNAASEAERAKQINPFFPDAYINQGVALGNLGNHAQAAHLFQKALDLDPNNGEAVIRLAIAYENLSLFNEALSTLQKGLNIDTIDRAKVYFLIGRINKKAGNLNAAIDASRQALAINPGYRDAFITIGVAHEKSGQRHKAFAVYKEAWDNGVDMVSILNSWALVSLEADLVEQAAEYLKLALEFAPDNPVSHENLAVAFKRMGRHDKAAREESIATGLRLRQAQ